MKLDDKIALLKKLHGESTPGEMLRQSGNKIDFVPRRTVWFEAFGEVRAFNDAIEKVVTIHNHLPDVLDGLERLKVELLAANHNAMEFVGARMRNLEAEVERLRSGYLADENENEYVQACILKEKIREQQAEIERLRGLLERCQESLHGGSSADALWEEINAALGESK